MKQLSWLILFVTLFLGISTQPALAADAVVGTGTLASCTETAFNTALATVQASGSGTITFNCGGAKTIVFTGSKIITNANVTIDGGNNITLSGANTVRHFYIDTNASLTVKNITLRYGFDNTYGGGSILNLGGLTLNNATIRDNNVDSGHSGGAIYSQKPVVITNSLLENNTAGSAGGLFLIGAVGGTITGTTFRNNRTTSAIYGLGGAITIWNGAGVTINQSTLEQNQARLGAAVYNESATGGMLIENNSIFRNNSATTGDGTVWNGGGGAIYNSAGDITIHNSSFEGNIALAGASGGAIVNKSGGLLQAFTTTFANNSAEFFGGAILNSDNASATITYVTLNNNLADEGGGITNTSYSTLYLSSSALYENQATTRGGAISNRSFSLANITNVTISDNTANRGGGISNRTGGTTNLVNVTFYHNDATISGGAIFHSASTTTLKNVIFAQWLAPNCESEPSIPPSFITSLGFNMSSDASCFLTQVGDIPNTNPWLGPLKNNGGWTDTHMPLSISSIIDAGQCTPNEDQRDVTRPQGAACDMGAVERIPMVLTGTRQSSTVAHLDWEDTEHDDYQVWRNTIPIPNANNVYVLYSTVAVSQADVPISSSQNYYYQVYGAFAGNVAEESNRVGVFSFAIVAGS
jgi:predicted outer membrane repeat protein